MRPLKHIIHRIKGLELQQKEPCQIAKELGIDPKTVRKYMEQEDFSPQAPVTETRPSKLDSYKATIEAWLAEDGQNRYKQRHTSKRVFDRLKQTYPELDCSGPVVVAARSYKDCFRVAFEIFRGEEGGD